MKPVVLILSLLLSFFSGERATVLPQNDRPMLSESPADNPAVNRSFNREICITAAQGYTFAGSGGSHSPSLRTIPTGRRAPSQIRSTFRMVKDGKIVDNNHAHPFLARSIVHLAGMYLSERYLFSICRLRL